MSRPTFVSRWLDKQRLRRAAIIEGTIMGCLARARSARDEWATVVEIVRETGLASAVVRANLKRLEEEDHVIESVALPFASTRRGYRLITREHRT